VGPGRVVADVGPGTGIFTRLLLETGARVIGIEPNGPMRAAAERRILGEPRFESKNGRAEATGLADASVDLVTAAQAFHWFEPSAARAEFVRILRRSELSASSSRGTAS
jgi:ubiquinone/menaquinone biosynthesis C-methylase UbiE